MSGLRKRLERLRGRAAEAPAAVPEPPPAAAGGALRGRLERLGAARRAAPAQGPRADESELARRLGGERIAEGLILAERRLAAGAAHGRRRLGAGLAEALAFFAPGAEAEPETTVFMDTETTGLAGGTGTAVFLLGLGRGTAHGLQLRQYLLAGFRGEAALLERVREFLDGARTLVTYNGRSFDAPLLGTRYRLAGLRDPFAGLQHLDLLHPTRRAFGSRWPDCRLRTAEQRLAGLEREGDLPSELAPAAWFDWLRHGDASRLPAVLEHNRLDVLSLAALLPALMDGYRRPRHCDADLLAVARHALARGEETRAYRHLLANRAHLDERAALELARLARRRGQTELALEIWQELALRENAAAIERLAKHCEHVARDVARALDLTRRLMLLEPWTARHERREGRLLRKLARGAPPPSRATAAP